MNASAVKTWWQQRERREQQVLLGGAALCALLLGWALVWYPLTRARHDLGVRLVTQQQDLRFMQDAAGQLRGLAQKDRQGHASREGKSLLALADASARDAGLGPTLKRIEPLDDKRVRIEFAASDFDVLSAWLQGLNREYGVRPGDVSIDRASGEGQVNARLTLVEP